MTDGATVERERSDMPHESSAALDCADTIATSACDPTILASLARHARTTGAEPAFTFLADDGTMSSLSFAALASRVDRVARHLHNRGLGGERVLLILPPGADYIVAFLGCLAAQAIAVPLFQPAGRKHADRLASVVADCAPRAILRGHDAADRDLAALREVFGDAMPWAPLIEELAKAAPARRPMPTIDSEDVAFLQYTSGSTGRAKGAMVTHANLIHNARMLAEATGNGPSSVHVTFLPLYHDMGMIGMILQSLYVGGHTIVMSPFRFMRKPASWLQAISDYRATVAGAPNFAYDMCVDRIGDGDVGGMDLSSWSIAYNGSEPVRPETMERFHRRFSSAGFRHEAFFPSYGLAEATLFVAGGPRSGPPRDRSLDRGALAAGRVIDGVGAGAARYASVHTPFADQTVRIVDPSNWRTVRSGTVGEIWLASRSVVRGYWQRPDETAETFCAYTTDTAEGPFLRTGDLGFIDGGRLTVTGRIKDLIIVAGASHYPQDIEATVQGVSPFLRQHAGAAFEMADGALGIVQATNRLPEDVDLVALVADVRRAVWQRHEIAPRTIALVHAGEIAKTSSGKVRRAHMRERLAGGELPVLHMWSAAPTERCPDTHKASLAHGAADVAQTADPVEMLIGALADERRDWLLSYMARVAGDGDLPAGLAMLRKTQPGDVGMSADVERRRAIGRAVVAHLRAAPADTGARSSSAEYLADAPNDRAAPCDKRDVRAAIRGWTANRCRIAIDTLDDADEFALLGLGSIDAVDLSATLTERFSVAIEPSDFFNYPSVDRLTAYVASQVDGDGDGEKDTVGERQMGATIEDRT